MPAPRKSGRRDDITVVSVVSGDHMSKKPRYEQRCRACLRRMIHYFIVTPADLQEEGLANTNFHHLLRFSEAAINEAGALRSDGSLDTTKLQTFYENLHVAEENDGRSKAQNTWLDTKVSLDANEFCTEDGLKCYKKFLSSLTKKLKSGAVQPLGMEGQKAYTKAVNRYFKAISFFPPIEHRERMKELHKQPKGEGSSKSRSSVASVTATVVSSDLGSLVQATNDRIDSLTTQVAEMQALISHLAPKGQTPTAATNNTSVPPNHQLGDVSLREALTLWDLGQPLLPDPETGEERSTGPFKSIDRSAWTDKTAAKRFSDLKRVMTALSPLLTLTGKSSLRLIPDVVVGCLDNFGSEADDSDHPLERSIQGVAQALPKRLSESSIKEWYHSAHAGSASSVGTRTRSRK